MSGRAFPGPGRRDSGFHFCSAPCYPHGPEQLPPRPEHIMNYAELAVTTNFTFLTGASHPEELVAEAARLGLAGLGIIGIAVLVMAGAVTRYGRR